MFHRDSGPLWSRVLVATGEKKTRGTYGTGSFVSKNRDETTEGIFTGDDGGKISYNTIYKHKVVLVYPWVPDN